MSTKTVKICDLCYQEIHPHESSYIFYKIENDIFSDKRIKTDLDVCIQCHEAIQRFIKKKGIR